MIGRIAKDGLASGKRSALRNVTANSKGGNDGSKDR